MNNTALNNQLAGWISTPDMQKIHEASLEILWERGMKLTHPETLAMLADAGAKIDADKQMVRIPPDLVMRCVDTVPASYHLGGRTPGFEIDLGRNARPWVRATSGAEAVIDLRTREYRPANTTDIIEWSRLLDALDNIHICCGAYPQDAPAVTRDVAAIKLMLEHNRKPLFVNPYDGHTTKAIIDMGVAVCGSKQAFKERPLITVLTSATAPGVILDYCVDILHIAGEYGMPVEVNTAPLMGGTCPVTIAGCMLQSNVEILALIVISQLAHPGAPLIHRNITMSMDMSTGAGVFGSMESAMAQCAVSQFVREMYNMPVSSFGPVSDAAIADGQSQIERSILTFLAGLTGSHLLLGAGFIDSLYTVDPVQLAIDDEIIAFLYRVMRGFEVDETTMAKELIMNLEPGGQYLDKDHTFEHFKSEHERPKCFSRLIRNAWEAKGATDLNHKAQQRALEIVEHHRVEPLDDAVSKELEAIYQAVTRLLSESGGSHG